MLINMSAMAADSEWLTAARACALLDVKRATLYAYVSRGLVRSRAVAGSRTRLYHRDDLSALKVRHDARAGHAPVAASALRWGEPVLDSSITEIRPDGPAYRGHPVLDLVRRRFEYVAELLWQVETPKLNTCWSTGLFDPPWKTLLRLVDPHTNPLDALLLSLVEIGSCVDVEPQPGTPARKEWASQLIVMLSASLALPFGERRFRRAAHETSIARRALVALGGEPGPEADALMNAALVLCADHELNASAFTCRVATSAGAELSKALAAGLCAISGSEHGGSTRRIQAMVAEIGGAELASRAVGERMRRGDAIPGFGHRLYPQGDPRCTPLLEGARKLGRRLDTFITLQSIVHSMELAGAEPPTLDVGLVAVSSALQLCPDAPLAIFALGRLAGLIAHADEQRLQGVMLRPRARFVPHT